MQLPVGWWAAGWLLGSCVAVGLCLLYLSVGKDPAHQVSSPCPTLHMKVPRGEELVSLDFSDLKWPGLVPKPCLPPTLRVGNGGVVSPLFFPLLVGGQCQLSLKISLTCAPGSKPPVSLHGRAGAFSDQGRSVCHQGQGGGVPP